MAVIVRYSEIGLKGKNRIVFENKLVKNIKSFLEKENIAYDKVRRIWGRIIIETDKKVDMIKRVFGISSFSFAEVVDGSIDDAKKCVDGFIEDFNEDTKFRVTTQRIDKKYPMTSMEIDKEIGAYVVMKTSAKVDLKNFDKEIGIEIIEGKIYVFYGKKRGYSGLPLGVEGKVLALIEDERDLLAAWFVMKRGCEVIPIGFNDFDISLLDKYGNENRFRVVGDINEVDAIVEETKSKALVVGQILDSLKEVNVGVVVLRPLIGFDVSEIEEKLNEIRI